MFLRKLFAISLTVVCFCAAWPAQTLQFEKERHKAILKMVKDTVKKNYFDPAFKGIDIEANHKAAIAKMDNAQSVGQMSGIIAQFLLDFDDSHLFFVPPGRVAKTDYGFDFGMIGENCFVLQIDKGSEAERLGLQVGDQMLGLEGYEIHREDLWKMKYAFFSLRPQAGLNVVARKPDGRVLRLPIPAKITEGKKITDLTGNDINSYIRELESSYRRRTRQYYFDKVEGLFIWKVPAFSINPNDVDEMMDRAKKAQAVVIDLRGNGGGRVDMVTRLISNLFEKDVKVADEKRRKETKELIAKTRGKSVFSGKVAVLIDSGSASASEVFARVLQLEGRGQVFGDRSAGAVMESMFYGDQLGMDRVVTFGTSVTIADLIMKDGKSLEHVGVTPDVLLLPTGKELAERRDIVLSKALESVGFNIPPEAAGKIFPIDDGDNY